MTSDIVSTARCLWTSRRCWICRLAPVSFINVNAQRTFFRSFGKPIIDTCNGFLVVFHPHNRIINHNLLFRKLLESLFAVLRCIENEKDQNSIFLLFLRKNDDLLDSLHHCTTISNLALSYSMFQTYSLAIYHCMHVNMYDY